MRRRKKRNLSAILVLVILLTAVAYLAWPNKAATPAKPANNSVPASVSPAGFNKALYSTTDPASIWVAVNKKHPLNPIDYAPSDLTVPSVPLRVPGNESMQLRGVSATALEQMFAGAKASGLNLMIASGYRSYNYQVGLYNGYVQSEGQAVADTQSARPGYSEHQTGLAVDIEPTGRNCELGQCFADTPEGKWLAANAYKYGFILRYTPDKVAITGYESEPWHFRYVGNELAGQMHSSNITTLEEFFGISGGQTY
jgi:zinc D-Ala-D-Ala carboxypeptidase